VVVIKAGRTQSGQRATLSHTGSMAGADAVYDAALRQCGAIRVHTIEEMFDLCKCFLYAPSLQGRRVAIVTNSGGPGVLAADRAEEVGLDVAEPSPAMKAKLSGFLPTHCALKNPIDLTVEGTENGYRKTLSAVLEEYDAALALNIAPPYLDSVPLARGTCDGAEQGGKPVLAAFLPSQVVTRAVTYLQEHGIPNFATGERAVTALARMADYGSWIADRGSRIVGGELQIANEELPGGGVFLEPEAMAWLQDNGFPVPEFRFAATQTEAMQGCREIGYPVVMKVVSPDILHKSEWNGVILDIRDDGAALDAFETIRQATEGKDLRGVVIYPMFRDGREVLLGLSRDPQFGPVIAFGLGGIYAETWRDISLRVAPIDRIEAERMIREIRSFPLLQGVRGRKPCDLDSLADVLVNFSRLPLRYPDIGEIDLNPVFLFSKGLVVGDVRVIRRDNM
jgi:acetyltransferase